MYGFKRQLSDIYTPRRFQHVRKLLYILNCTPHGVATALLAPSFLPKAAKNPFHSVQNYSSSA
jgi:hypothetical protein